VYVAGLAPDEGEVGAEFQSKFPAAVAGPYIKPSPLPDDGTEFTIDPSGFHEAFCAGLPDAVAAFMEISRRPISGVAYTEKAPAPAWRTGPSWAVLPTADGVIHADVHRFSYDRMGAVVTVAEGASHVVMLSRPAIVADVVREAVRSCASGGIHS
jgi:pimeloyl-ACP methyl ester carboxylesterase